MNRSILLWILFTLLRDTAVSVCVPQHNVTALVIGQDLQSISNYSVALKHNNVNPFAVMSYISLTLNNDTIAGLEFPVDYGSGVEWVEELINEFDGSSIQLGLWISDSYDSISTGKYDKSLQILSNYVNKTNRDFYLRIGYEFDSVANNFDPEIYRIAFRYIVAYFRKENVINVAFVWHAAGFQPKDSLSYDAWFPGADVVDWCGVSLFQQPYYCGTQSNCTSMYYADKFANYCSERRLPLMIAESTPFGGITDASPSSQTSTSSNSTPVTATENRAGYVGDTWEIWFEPVLAYIDRHDVRMWSYINCNWDIQPMWRTQHAPGIYWGDTRIEGKEYVFLCAFQC